jgi:hypothetical protein
LYSMIRTNLSLIAGLSSPVVHRRVATNHDDRVGVLIPQRKGRRKAVEAR